MKAGYLRPSSSINHVQNSGTGICESTKVTGAHGVQTQNVKSARVYVFGDSVEDDEVTEQTEMPELRARGSGARRQQAETNGGTVEEEVVPTYFEKTLSAEDTLLGVALKYGCKVSELKRINNLIQDQDFYGLKTVRIPLRRHGLLNELVQEQLNNGIAHQDQPKGGATSGYNGYDVEVDDDDDGEYDPDRDTENRALLVRNLSIRDSFGTQSREAVDFLKKMDSDIKNIVHNTNSRKDTLEEVRDTLTCKSIQPLRGRGKLFDGVDCGMRWWSVMIVMLVLLLGCPLLYFLYFEYIKPSS